MSHLRPEAGAAASKDAKTAISGITLIVVSWKDRDDLVGCLESLSAARRRAAAGGPEVSLVVVDNGAQLAEPGPIRSLWPGASWIVNESNRGLGPAANQAAAAATGDVLLFMNPDTRAEGEPYSEIARAFAGKPEVVAVAPRLIDAGVPPNGRSGRLSPPDREDQFTFQLRRLPTLGSDARQLLLFDHLFPNNAGRRRDRYADRDRESPFAVEQAAGAALA
ncbi:MAG TPA: glycosyltransferase, partial [Thermoanaerobaculia bacterium]